MSGMTASRVILPFMAGFAFAMSIMAMLIALITLGVSVGIVKEVRQLKIQERNVSDSNRVTNIPAAPTNAPITIPMMVATY